MTVRSAHSARDFGGFGEKELRVLKRLGTPAKIQDFLDFELPYNYEEKGETLCSPREVLRRNKAHCFEGALFAACALRYNGFPPLLMDLVATRDEDHVLALFKQRGCWGALAKSKFVGLRYREPIFKTLRELALSYFEGYYNYSGEKTLRSFSEPIDLRKCDRLNWMSASEGIWEIGKVFPKARHHRLVSEGKAGKFRLADGGLFKSEVLGGVGKPLIKQKPFDARKLV